MTQFIKKKNLKRLLRKLARRLIKPLVQNLAQKQVIYIYNLYDTGGLLATELPYYL